MATDEDAYLLRDMTRDLLLAGRLWRKIARQVAARHGVSEAASSPLIWIERLGESVRQNALAEAIGIEGASLVRLMDELETAGLIIRATDPSDRRANAVKLTERGVAVVKEVNDALTALRLDVFRDVPAKDIRAAMKVFDAIKAASSQ